MDVLAALLVLAAVLLAWADPRVGGVALLVVGFVMDPLRKLMPGQPLLLTGVVAIVVVALYVGVRRRGRGPGEPRLLDAHPLLNLPLTLGAVWVLIEVVRGYDTTGSAIVALIGLMAYAMPALAIATGYGMFATGRSLDRFLGVYVGLCAIVAVSVLLAFSGVGSPLFAQVGRGIAIYAPDIGMIQLHGGLLRGPELAGWHLATGLCVLAILAVGARRRIPFSWAVPCFLVMAPALLVTGRRKYLVLVAVFMLLWASLSMRHRRGRPIVAVGLLALAVLAAVALTGEVAGTGSKSEILQRHMARVAWGGSQAGGRFENLALTSLPIVVAENGVLGSGAGTGSQGAQHFGAGARVTGAASEGGLGKVLAELGLPGLLLTAWLAWALARSALRGLHDLRVAALSATDVASGLCAMLAANVLTFSLGHQVYGDPFVLCMLGLLSGALLRMPHQEPAPTPWGGSAPGPARGAPAALAAFGRGRA